jgi:hypothetical protein
MAKIAAAILGTVVLLIALAATGTSSALAMFQGGSSPSLAKGPRTCWPPATRARTR